MESRRRRIVATLWIGVAAIMGLTLELGVPTTLEGGLRLFVVLMALFLAVMYLIDPWGIIDRTHSMEGTEQS